MKGRVAGERGHIQELTEGTITPKIVLLDGEKEKFKDRAGSRYIWDVDWPKLLRSCQYPYLPQDGAL
jgi:hypothetical protein